MWYGNIYAEYGSFIAPAQIGQQGYAITVACCSRVGQDKTSTTVTAGGTSGEGSNIGTIPTKSVQLAGMHQTP